MYRFEILERIKKIGGFKNQKEVARIVLTISPQSLSNMKKRKHGIRSKYIEIIDWAIRERISLDYIFRGQGGIELQAFGRFTKAQKEIPSEEFDEVAAIAFKFWEIITVKDHETRARNIAIMKGVIQSHYEAMIPGKQTSLRHTEVNKK